MDLKLKPFDLNQALARAGLAANGQPLAARAAPVAGGSSFSNAMADALKSVNQQMVEVDRMQRAVVSDNPTVSIEQTMVAMQKAQIGFQTVLQVRNKLVAAYTDIMNMQV
ncbi:MAG: flagellar hook-basal body complex protein FliE [Burkholderiales bacterium]|nr:flagellar hook-basal body complex protein FliE [Burkholderiales bacterium]MDE2395204.1 flagellar hook-basal body complex protein FliE [Burkholderiales bacterium]